MKDNKKKILYLSPNGYIGGAEKFVLDACNMHIYRGNYSPAILFFNDGQAIVRANDLGIPVHKLNFRVRMRNPIAFFRTLLKIRRLVSSERFDIVHATMPYSHIFCSLALLGKSVKKVWFQHGPVGGLLDFIASLLPVDKVFFNSQFLCEQHCKKTPLKLRDKKMVIIPLGISPEVQDVDLSREYLDHLDQLLVGMVGRITPWKGFHSFIDAIAHLKKTNERIFAMAKYIIVGDAKTEKDKVYEQRLRESVVEKGVADCVYFLGYRPDVANIYGSLDVFVHASTIPEPFGYVVAEAMQYDTVVIGGNCGGIQDLLRDEETGLTFPSTDPDAYVFLAKKLEDVLTEYDKFKIIKENGKRFIAARYSLSQMSVVLEHNYDQLFE